jgi:hypothetical protein
MTAKNNHPAGTRKASDLLPDPKEYEFNFGRDYLASLEAGARDEQLEREWERWANTVYRYFEENAELLLSKHKDYGPKNIASAPGGALNGLRVRIHDKTARINHLIDNGADPENESLRDSFVDLANYATIALLVLDGEWPNE